MAHCEVKTSSLVMLAECAIEIIPRWLMNCHEYDGRNGCTFRDTLEMLDNHCGRKRALSTNWDTERPSKLTKYEAGPIVFPASKPTSHPSPHPSQVSTIPDTASVPVPRLISPPPKRAQIVPSSPVEDDVDITWIPSTYLEFVPKDTLMHTRFMSECTYPMPTYNPSGGVKKRNCEQRKQFLENDEWVTTFDVYQVVCKGCGMDVGLDKRSGFYYPGFWVKHRSVCPAVYAIWLQMKGMSHDADKEWFRRHKPMVE